jgi:sulfate-transporting ATPase
VKIAHVDQSRESLQGDKTVFEDVCGGQDNITVGKFQMPSRVYLARFNFPRRRPAEDGRPALGRRARPAAARQAARVGRQRAAAGRASNDLDVETLRALEEALLEFAGSVLVISHDRWFLDRIATHILAFEGESQAVFFAGNYQEYEADKRKRLGEEGARPHRIRYKPLKI